MVTLAAVDIGANSVRLKIARVERRWLRVLHEDREVVRLGEGVFRTGALDPAAMEQTVQVLRRFHKAVQAHGATRVRVVATSALRDSNNGSAFVHWVKAAVGWRVEVVSGVEEGRLIHLGVTTNTRISTGRMLLIDLGGGSCELIVSFKGQIERVYSLPLGAVRLTREFLKHDPPSETELEQMRAYIGEEVKRVRRELTQHKITQTVATSGTPAALSELWAAGQGGESATVPRAALLRLTKKLSTFDVERRRALKGIGPRRAEIIVAGAHVFAELFAELDLSSFRYLPFGLRDGILAQMAADQEGIGPRKQLENERNNSILSLASHYNVDMRFSMRVADHARRLFRLLAPVHNLPSEYAPLLNAAALLHEVGSFISRAGRRRHAHYILAHSELMGFTLPQRRVIAAIARYLGKSKILPAHRAVSVLSPTDRFLMPRAVMLLRLARAAELGRRGAVVALRTKLEPGNVRLTLVTKPAGAELELWALEKERDYFREIFGCELTCIEA
ncbi:MAG: exopolyphosphatase [Acidobacteria bacterium]|mgnify:CR=1 FL=1|nr:MAG: exopolyphosphatase [Acidobacteriota bacterium]